MKARTLSAKRLLGLGIATLFLPALAFALAIPEPPLIIYGSVTNTSGASVLTNGAVAWSVGGGGSSTTVSATIANLNGQFFHLARLPFETRATLGRPVAADVSPLHLNSEKSEPTHVGCFPERNFRV
ncbi:MAG: hypothetical protein KIS67_02270 [Verrucomicrobiae bacterium]|nr:hypothetical protein [Verrucomicrobiae bacterium]